MHRRLCLYRPQMKSPHRSHHVGWAWLQGWKLCPSPLSSVNCGSWVLLRTLMIPTRLSRSGTFPGLILKAFVLSRRGGEKGACVNCIGSLCDLRSWSSINSPIDIASLRLLSPVLSLTRRKTYYNKIGANHTFFLHFINMHNTCTSDIFIRLIELTWVWIIMG